MKKVLISIILYCFCQLHTYAQDAEYEFAESVFKKEYKRRQFAPFNGKVETIDEHTFRYGEKVLSIDTEDKSVMTIFSRGIFHPDIIDGKETIKALTKSQLDTMSIENQLFYNLSRNDSIRIGEIEELTQLNPDFKTKRFVFWLYQRGMANPTECYFELYNNQGTQKMTMEKFVSGSRVTFYYKGTIII